MQLLEGPWKHMCKIAGGTFYQPPILIFKFALAAEEMLRVPVFSTEPCRPPAVDTSIPLRTGGVGMAVEWLHLALALAPWSLLLLLVSEGGQSR